MRILRAALPALIGIAIVLGLVAAALHTNNRLLRDAERMRFNDRTSMVRNRAAATSQMIEDPGKIVRGMATAPWQMTAGSAADKARLDALVRSAFGHLHGVALLDTDGRIVASSGDGSEVPPATDPGYLDLRGRLEAGQPGVSPIMRIGGGVPTHGYGAGIVDAAGARRGTIVIFTAITRGSGYRPMTDTASIVRGGEAMPSLLIFDRNRVVAAGKTESDIGTQLPDLAVYQRATQGMPGHGEIVEAGVRKVVLYEPIGKTGYVMAFVQDAASFYGPLRAHHRTGNLLLFSLLGLFGIAVVVLWARNHQLVRRKEEQLGALLAHAADAVVVVKGDRVVYASPAAEQITGRATADIAEQSFRALMASNEECDRFDGLVARAAADPGAAASGEIGVAHRDGGTRWTDTTVVDLSDTKTVGGLVVTLHDVTERRALEAEVSHRALHDSLTDLANRTLFQNRIELAAERAKRHPSINALLYIDLDRFKPVNDDFGHHAGDAVLTAVADHLRGGVRSHDTVARMGGDEFAVLLENLEHADDAVQLAQRLLRSISEPVEVDGRRISVGASIGIAVVDGGSFDPETLARNADLAMYVAKDSHDRSIVVFGEAETTHVR